MRSKFGNRKLRTEDGVFDSKLEYARWCDLRLLERAGDISDLKRQVPFVVIEKFRDNEGKRVQETRYVADFVYTEDGVTIIEDAKGHETDVFRIKWKLLKRLFANSKTTRLRLYRG